VPRPSGGGNYNVVQARKFAGGLQTGHPTAIGDNALTEAENVVYTLEGHVKPRKAIKRRFASDFSSAPVVGMAPYYGKDGITKVVMASGNSLYVDQPHLTFSYDTVGEWSQSGVYTNCAVSDDVQLLTTPAAEFLGTATYEKIWI